MVVTEHERQYCKPLQSILLKTDIKNGDEFLANTADVI